MFPCLCRYTRRCWADSRPYPVEVTATSVEMSPLEYAVPALALPSITNRRVGCANRRLGFVNRRFGVRQQAIGVKPADKDKQASTINRRMGTTNKVSEVQ